MTGSELLLEGPVALAERLRERELSAVELTEAALARIEHLEPQLNAFRVVHAEAAIAQARAAQRRLDEGARSPLLGIPVAVKDDVDLGGELTAKGTAAKRSVAERDGELVRRLRVAGSVIVGKTNVSELTAWTFTETAAYGVTRNPWRLGRSPGGSSGGSAVAVATGMCALASAGDGGGSIRIPAAWCGLFGLKPQRGRVPIAPADDAWQGLAVNGPLARRAEDIAAFLDACCPAPGRDGASWVQAARRAPGALSIGIWDQLPPGYRGVELDDYALGPLTRVAERLRRAGHATTQAVPEFPRDAVLQFTARMLRGLHDDLANTERPDLAEPRVRTLARIGKSIPGSLIALARRRERALAAAVDRVFEAHDLLLAPGPVAGPWRIGELAGRSAMQTLIATGARAPFQNLFNVSGHPVLNIPAGFDGDGLPVGVQLVARQGQEVVLLQVARQLEKFGLTVAMPPMAWASAAATTDAGAI